MDTVRVIHVDPDPASRARVRDRLGDRDGVDLTSYEAPPDADVLADAVDCVVTEYDLGDRTGLDLVEQVREADPDTGCILFSDADRDVRREASAATLAAYVPKSAPAALGRLARLVQTTAAHRSQTAYPLPDDEGARLDAIDALALDSEPLAAALDRVTGLAAAHFDVDYAAVGVVGERTETFVACAGGPVEPIDRQDTACTYAILDDESVTVVEDYREDPRFADVDAVHELGLRFYAGTVVETPEGYPLGTLCLFDEDTRPFDDADADYLRLLAAEASAWVEHLGTQPAETEVEAP